MMFKFFSLFFLSAISFVIRSSSIPIALPESFDITCKSYFKDDGAMRWSKERIEHALENKTFFYCLHKYNFSEEHKKDGYKLLTSYFKKNQINMTILHPDLFRFNFLYIDCMHMGDKIRNVFFKLFTQLFSKMTEAIEAEKADEKLLINCNLDEILLEITTKEFSAPEITSCLNCLAWCGNRIIVICKTLHKHISFDCNDKNGCFTEEFLDRMNGKYIILQNKEEQINITKLFHKENENKQNMSYEEIRDYLEIKNGIEQAIVDGKVFFFVTPPLKNDPKDFLNQLNVIIKKNKIPLIVVRNDQLESIYTSEFKEADVQDCLKYIIGHVSHLALVENEIVIDVASFDQCLYGKDDTVSNEMMEKLSKICRNSKVFFKSVAPQYSIRFVSLYGENQFRNKFFTEEFLSAINEPIAPSCAPIKRYLGVGCSIVVVGILFYLFFKKSIKVMQIFKN